MFCLLYFCITCTIIPFMAVVKVSITQGCKCLEFVPHIYSAINAPAAGFRCFSCVSSRRYFLNHTEHFIFYFTNRISYIFTVEEKVWTDDLQKPHMFSAQCMQFCCSEPEPERIFLQFAVKWFSSLRCLFTLLNVSIPMDKGWKHAHSVHVVTQLHSVTGRPPLLLNTIGRTFS